MTKRQIIDEILEINGSAGASFLAQFGKEDLTAYLARLQLLMEPRLAGDVSRFEKYFDRHAVAPQATSKAARWRGEEALPAAQPVAREPVVAAEEADARAPFLQVQTATRASLFPATA
jgi:hypothetical protein